MQPLFKVRASCLGQIMVEPKAKSETLSAGAKTYLETVAKELVYGYTYSPSSKAMEKGTMVEQQSIDLYNSVFFTSHEKNTERRENDWLTGECDIDTGTKIIDIKSSWSLVTFPATVHAATNRDYEWQVRAYMLLWDRDEAEIAHSLVSTPDELIGYEDPSLHFVDHIEEQLRITRVHHGRDKSLEARMQEKCEAAQRYVIEVMQRIAEEHRG